MKQSRKHDAAAAAYRRMVRQNQIETAARAGAQPLLPSIKYRNHYLTPFPYGSGVVWHIRQLQMMNVYGSDDLFPSIADALSFIDARFAASKETKTQPYAMSA